MTQCLIENVTCLFQKVIDTDIINTDAKRQGIDEHTYRVGYLQVAAPTTNRT